jgi:hypothetical protein
VSVDKYFNREYDVKKYNCAHLVCEAWKDLTGFDLVGVLGGFLSGAKDRKTILSDLRKMQPLDKVTDPCIVLMQQGRNAPHIGLYVRGRVLHIRKEGVEFQPLDVATMGFPRVRFYTC